VNEPASLDGEALEAALTDDLAQRAPTSPGRVEPLVNPAMEDKLLRAAELHVELAGFAGLTPETKTNANVVDTVWPKVREYCALRIELVVNQVVESLAAELRIPVVDVLGALGQAPPQMAVSRTSSVELARLNLVLKEELIQQSLVQGIAAEKDGNHEAAHAHVALAAEVAKL